eukprot:scaffold106487_cov60-Phaeocystis_antarctica.AAC.2
MANKSRDERLEQQVEVASVPKCLTKRVNEIESRILYSGQHANAQHPFAHTHTGHRRHKRNRAKLTGGARTRPPPRARSYVRAQCRLTSFGSADPFWFWPAACLGDAAAASATAAASAAAVPAAFPPPFEASRLESMLGRRCSLPSCIDGTNLGAAMAKPFCGRVTLSTAATGLWSEMETPCEHA